MLKALLILLLSTHSFAQSKASKTLFKAIEKNDIFLAQNAIKAGADVNGVNDFKRPETTVVLKAIELDRTEILELLLNNRAEVNQRRPRDFYTGLMMAAELNRAELVKQLLKHGADVNHETINGETALHLAAKRNAVEAAKVLLTSKEIDVNSGGEKCALWSAAKIGHVGMVLLLKKHSSPVCLDLAQVDAHINVRRFLKRP